MRVLRAMMIACSGMGMCYVLFFVIGPYWSRFAATEPRQGPKGSEQKIGKTQVHLSADEFSEWVEAAPEGEVREAIVHPDGTFELKRFINERHYEPSPVQGYVPNGPERLLIGEIESDVYGKPR